MPRRFWPQLVAAALAVIGLVLVGAGVLLSTVWKPSPTTTVRVLGETATPVVETAPGVLSLGGPHVSVQAQAPASGTQVFLGIGRTADVEAYLADVARQELSGMDEQGRAVVATRGQEPTVVDPATVDVWTASVVGRGVATLTWPEQPGRWSLVAATNGADDGPESVTFTWTKADVQSVAPAVIALGVLLLVAGLVTVALLMARAREEVVE